MKFKFVLGVAEKYVTHGTISWDNGMMPSIRMVMETTPRLSLGAIPPMPSNSSKVADLLQPKSYDANVTVRS